MWSWCQNSKSKLAKQRKNDMSILMSVQRAHPMHKTKTTTMYPMHTFKKPLPPKMQSRFRTHLASQHSTNSASVIAVNSVNKFPYFEEKENIPEVNGSTFLRKSGTSTNCATSSAHVTLSSFPKFIGYTETSRRIHSKPNPKENQNMARPASAMPFIELSPKRPGQRQPVSQNHKFTTRWGVFRSEVVDRGSTATSFVVNGSQSGNKRLCLGSTSSESGVLGLGSQTSESTEFIQNINDENMPMWLKHLISSTSTATTNPQQGSVVLGQWARRNLTQSSPSTIPTDPAITSKYSIAQLVDVLCGVVPVPEEGFFAQEESEIFPNEQISCSQQSLLFD